jgi:hypothetical protein
MEQYYHSLCDNAALLNHVLFGGQWVTYGAKPDLGFWSTPRRSRWRVQLLTSATSISDRLSPPSSKHGSISCEEARFGVLRYPSHHPRPYQAQGVQPIRAREVRILLTLLPGAIQLCVLPATPLPSFMR